MKLNVLQIIFFCLINYSFTFPNDLFDELWETNQSEPQPNNNPIEPQPKIKVEPHEEQFDGRWRDESALKGVVKVEHEPPFGTVKLERKDKIKHEFEWGDEESGEFKEQLEDHVKKEDQDRQAPNTSDHKKIGNDDEKWSEDENKSAPSADDLDQGHSLSDQNNSTDQDESVDVQQNESNECDNIESDQQKLEIIQKFREMKDNYREKNKCAHSAKEWNQIDTKISNGLGVSRTKLYKWIKELGLTPEKFSEFKKREILKQFDKIKSKCKKAELKNISMRELDDKIAKKLSSSARTIFQWKRKFGLSGSNKISDATKIGILKKYAKMKIKNPKMTDAVIANIFNISSKSLCNWKKQFKEEIL